MQTKRGQAAMEFLMTYGWAILAAIIAIGVLAYFGVFTPGKYVSGTAIVNAPFYVNAHNIKTTGIELELRNNGGEEFSVTALTIAGCAGTVAPTLPVTVNVGSLQKLTVPCTLVAGNTFKGDITVTYLKSGSTTDLQSTGTIADKVA